jgi:hypothetical protein
MSETKTVNKSAYVEKVRKLLVKAEGASTSEEAEAFFAKAQSLITKWEIEEAELRPEETQEGSTGLIYPCRTEFRCPIVRACPTPAHHHRRRTCRIPVIGFYARATTILTPDCQGRRGRQRYFHSIDAPLNDPLHQLRVTSC